MAVLKKFQCFSCGYIYKRKFTLERHEKTCSLPKKGSTEKVRCGLCDFISFNRPSVAAHYKNDHELPLVQKFVDFECEEDCKNWISNFEKKNNVHYRKFGSTYVSKSKRVERYVCHRDGNFVSEGNGLRRLKIKGSSKINAHCPSNIVVYKSNSKISIKYVELHVGHDPELAHINLTESERKYIACKIEQKIPFTAILNDIRNSVTDNHRLQLLTRKDLWNIASSFNLNHQEILLKNDCVSVDAWVEPELESEDIHREDLCLGKNEHNILNNDTGDDLTDSIDEDNLQIIENAIILEEFTNINGENENRDENIANFAKRKEDALKQVIKAHDLIENEAQLQDFINHTSFLESMIISLSNRKVKPSNTK